MGDVASQIALFLSRSMHRPRVSRLRGLCRTAPQALRRRDGVHPAQPAQGAGRARRERPGHLPDHLTVEHIRAGNSNLRNPKRQIAVETFGR